MTRRYLAANWKMNVPEEGVDVYVERLANWPVDPDVEVIVAPPFVFIDEVSRVSTMGDRSIHVAGQDCWEADKGAFTGEISAPMLAANGASYVILGHSERRRIFGEESSLIGRKLAAALGNELVAIFCIGEEESAREAGETLTVLESQIRGGLRGLENARSVLVAYEPVWAIGTGKNATPEIVQETHLGIREILEAVVGTDLPILYGGSVSPANAEELAAVEGVDGFLVGGASLDSSKLESIYRSLSR